MATATTPPRTGNQESTLEAVARFGAQSLIACGEIIAIGLAPPTAHVGGRTQTDGIETPHRIGSLRVARQR